MRVQELSRNVRQGKRSQRTAILRMFRANRIDLLVCSDGVSRGLDLPNLDIVINVESPKTVEQYVHRVGRTARGTGEGLAITMLNNNALHHFEKMLEGVENGDKLAMYAFDGLTPRQLQ